MGGIVKTTIAFSRPTFGELQDTAAFTLQLVNGVAVVMWKLRSCDRNDVDCNAFNSVLGKAVFISDSEIVIPVVVEQITAIAR